MIKKSDLNISNLLSLVRIFLAVPVVYFISENDNIMVIYFSFLAMLTDWFDGFFARKLKQITELGKIIDPIADKILIGSAVFSLYYFQDFPLWLAALIVLRDLFILIGALFIYEKHKQITSSNWPGKVSVFLIACAILAFLGGLRSAFDYLIILAFLAILFSAIMYAKVFWGTFYGKKSK